MYGSKEEDFFERLKIPILFNFFIPRDHEFQNRGLHGHHNHGFSFFPDMC